MQYLEAAKRYESEIIALRRMFHEWPELSGKEEETVARICTELDKIGVEYTVVPQGGVLAKITGGKNSGKAVLLRADMDALPVTERQITLSWVPAAVFPKMKVLCMLAAMTDMWPCCSVQQRF